MIVFVIWYSLQRIVNRHRFLKYTQLLRNLTTSDGCKNFSMGLGYTLWVSRRSAYIRAFQRTNSRDHRTHRSKNICEKLIFMQKNTVSYTFLNLTFLVWDSKKLDFSESRRWLWEARKNFWCVVRSYCLLSETSLGPCASNKVRGVIICCTNPFLLTQTWELIDFCILIIAEGCFWRGENVMKSVILMVFLNFSGR